MEQRAPFVRVLKLSRLLETFFIASVTTILVIRAFLAATGYPQLGGTVCTSPICFGEDC